MRRTLQKRTTRGFSYLFILLFFKSLVTAAQKLDVAYVPTPEFVVERMLDMAKVGPGDYIIDLGCGDGRIVIAAAKRGAIGHGVDLDQQRIKEARANARKAGVEDQVIFLEQNIYDTDFSRANVIAMYLFPTINIKLRPLFLDQLDPGTRIVSHDFGMDEWKPDEQHGRMENHAVYLWIVPAQIEGSWIWSTAGENFKMEVDQKFQEIKIRLKSEKTVFTIENSLLSGKRISFIATETSKQRSYVFSGQANKGGIEGIVQIHHGETYSLENWTAVKD